MALKSKTNDQDAGTSSVKTMETMLELNKDTFYPFLKGEEAGDKLVIIDFYTDWCGPCKLIYPDLLILQKQLQPKGVLFAKFNCNKENLDLGTFQVFFQFNITNILF